MSIPAIDISKLSKFYGKARGIENVDLEIKEGEIFGFIGPNGAGKSTTIRILLNLIFPTSGNARILGSDVVKDTKKIKRLTGYIPSDANAYGSMRVHEFLAYCLRFYNDGTGPDIQDRSGELTSFFDLDPQRKIADLSMGNRKKVAIAQSFIHSPKLLIVDEPTTGLDPLMQARFFELIRKENERGMTVFFSSHVLSEVQMLCGRVAIIKEGRIVQVEDIETLRKKQLKRIHVETSDIDSARAILGSFRDITEVSPGTLSFMYSGDINKIVSLLAGVELRNLTIEEPSLEEIFMHYYK